MEIWQIWCICAFVLLILEMFTPTLFFLNLSLAALVVSVFSYFGFSFIAQAVMFTIISISLIAFLRPLLVKKINGKDKQTGISAKYINNIATVVNEVTELSGRIAIYGEEWDARSMNDEVIPVGSKVKIVKNESLIMFVEKYEE